MNKVTIINRAHVNALAFLNQVLNSFSIDAVAYADNKTIQFVHEHYSGDYVYTGTMFAKVD